MKENNILLDQTALPASDSENDSDKTRDTASHMTTDSVFKSA